MVSNRGWRQGKSVSNQLRGSDWTDPYPLQSSPYEGLFQERLQSRTGAPPTSEPWPPAVPAWNSLWGCVRSGRLSWPSLSDPYTPPGMFSNTAPPVGSWKYISGKYIDRNILQNQKQRPYLLQVMRPFLWQAWHALNLRLMPSITAFLQLNELLSLCTSE